MKPRKSPHARPNHGRHCTKPTGVFRGFLKRWFVANSLVSGFFALCWLLLRSGAKPSRLAYPCQQAAISAAMLAFAAPVVAVLVASRRRVAAGLRTRAGVGLAGLGLVVTACAWGYLVRADEYSGPIMKPRGSYRAQVYNVTECPEDSIGARFIGVDNLISLMGREGLKFYQSATESPVAGPGGIIAADDTVAIKINYQWSQRGGTNVDVLRGLVRRIVNHPDTFSGEIVICENTQFVTGAAVDGFDYSQNNAQDHALSPHDVVAEFQGLGHTISHYAWRVIRGTQVDEYANGDMADGYVVYPYDAALHGKTSYPKFQTDYGTYMSLKLGIWDPGSSSYDRDRLKFINMPVLKSHSGYGVTAAVKHHMGTVTGILSTNSHNAIEYGILGALLGEIRPADLNILDCIWVNAIPRNGPGTSYAEATRKDQLVASLDPVAADIWATTNILGPAFEADNPASDFRQYLDNSMNYILAAGDDATNDLRQIDAFTWNGDGDFDVDSDVDLADAEKFAQCYSGPDGGVGAGCDAGDFDDDGDVDCDDWDEFRVVWTEPVAPPGFGPCLGTGPIPTVSQWGLAIMALLILTAGTLVHAPRSGGVSPA